MLAARDEGIMSRTGTEVFVVGVASTLLGSLLSFAVVSVGISASTNKRRATLVEARKLQGIPDAIVVESDEDVEAGGVGGAEDGSNAIKRKESAASKRRRKLLEIDIPIGEVYDGAYGKRERDSGLCYSIFTRKSTVMLHLHWAKIMSVLLLVLQCGMLAIMILRGLFILEFPQFGLSGVVAAVLLAVHGISLHSHCVIRWIILLFYLPVMVAVDLMDSASLAMAYTCNRDGHQCSTFTSDVLLVFFCLRMLSFFIVIWLAMLTAFISFELGCCNDKDTYPVWNPNYDTRTVSLDCLPTKDFTRHKGRSLQAAILERKKEIEQQRQAKENKAKQSPKMVFVSALSGAGRTKKSVFKKKSLASRASSHKDDKQPAKNDTPPIEEDDVDNDTTDKPIEEKADGVEDAESQGQKTSTSGPPSPRQPPMTGEMPLPDDPIHMHEEPPEQSSGPGVEI